jgi:hypothetical protein
VVRRGGDILTDRQAGFMIAAARAFLVRLEGQHKLVR